MRPCVKDKRLLSEVVPCTRPDPDAPPADALTFHEDALGALTPKQLEAEKKAQEVADRLQESFGKLTIKSSESEVAAVTLAVSPRDPTTPVCIFSHRYTARFPGWPVHSAHPAYIREPYLVRTIHQVLFVVIR